MSGKTGPKKRKAVPVTPTAVRPATLDRLDGYLAKRSKLVLASIVVLSDLLRIGYFFELNAGPCIWQHRWTQSDMNFFDHWAGQIAAGDWLCQHVDPPVHQWHELVAQEYYQHHPQELEEARRAEAAGGASPARSLWNRWAGENRFYQDPAYPYLVALTYKICPDVRCVFAWQMLAGVFTNVLVYLVARRLFGHAAGALAGLTACLYAPLLHMELLLLRETLVVLAALAMVYVCDLARQRASFRWWAVAGLVMGISVVLKAHFGLFVLGSAGLLVLEYFRRRRVLLRCAGGLALGVALGMAPLAARNVAVGVSPLETATSAQAAFALWNGYEPDAGVVWRPHAAERVMEETGGRGSVIWATLRTHPGLGSVIEMLAARFAKGWHWYELSDSANLYYYALHSTVLHLMPFTFFALAPVSIVGLALVLRQARKCAFLYLQVLANLAVLTLFFPVGRFRLPMAAALIPFGALAIVRLAGWLGARRYGPAVLVLAAVVLVGLWTGRPLPDSEHEIREADFRVPYDVYYKAAIEQEINNGDWRRAADQAGELIRCRPDWLDAVGPGRPPRTAEESSMVDWFIQLHRMCAQIYQHAGRAEDAQTQQRSADRLSESLKPVAPGYFSGAATTRQVR